MTGGRLLFAWSASLAIGLLCLPATTASAAGPAKFMMTTHVNGRVLEGQPLTWTDRQMLLLGRDGQLYEFEPEAAKDSQKTSTRFQGYTVSEMRNRLRAEFDKSFDISTTAHFVVVHPRGQWSAWAERLESLFRSFTHYMQVRSFSIQQTQVPLVAIVFRNQSDYYRHAAASGTPLQPGTLGHYDPQSNRIFLFDATTPDGETDWSANAETIIHEATHQTAFNVGVHRRFAEQPRWVVEGLATMFEARGVWDGRSVYQQSDRINRGRLEDFRALLQSRPDNVLAHLVSSDQLFRSNPGAAYAEAWGLTFFLCETQPQAYSQYLARVAARKPFAAYPAKERLIDFMSIFGKDLELLDAQLLRFVSKLD
ncbi:MAG: DUF1570 domain-containing protein [Planctomycetales bacterium]|nr:DUF1570 domain-containing protein [Planctomycetales bacterium]